MSGGRLVVLDRAGRDGKRFPLAEGLATLGCDPACDIRIMLPSVSPHHATVVVHANQTVIRNVCADETLVNGRGVSVAALRHGDVISIGGRHLRWEYADPDARRPQAPEPALHLPRRKLRAGRRGSGPAPARARDPQLQLKLELEHRASMPGSAGGKQVAIVQPQRRDTGDQIGKTSPHRRPPSPAAPPPAPQSPASKRARTPRSELDTVDGPLAATQASLWIESRKPGPRKRPRSALGPKVEGPLRIDHTKQAAIRLMTGHTPKSKPSSPSFVVKKPSPVRRTPRSRNTRSSPSASPGNTSASPSSTSATPSNTSSTPGKTSATPGNTSATPGNTSATPGNSSATPGNTSATPGNTSATPGNSSSRRSGANRTVTILEITDSDGRNSSVRNSYASRLLTQKSSRKSGSAPSLRKSAGAPSPRRSGSAPSPRKSAGAPSLRRSSGAPSPRKSAGAPSLRRSSGAPSPRKSASAPSPRRSGSAPNPRKSAGAPSPRKSASAPSPRRSASAPSPRRSAGAPSLRRSSGAPSPRKSAGVPSPRKSAGAPSLRRSSGASSPRKSAGAPSPRRSASAPIPRKSAGAPNLRRSSGAPSPRKSAGAPSLRRSSGAPSPRKLVDALSLRKSSSVPSPRKSAGAPSIRRSSGAPSPRKSALKDPAAKRGARKTESIKFDLSNLESHSQDTDVVMLSDSTRASDDDVTLRYSESPAQSPSPSPRRSIHSRSSRMLEQSVGSSVQLCPPSRAPPSPPRWRSARGSLLVQRALGDSGGAARQPRTLSPRAERHDLESYSIVDLVSVDTDESALSASAYGSVDSTASTAFGTPQNTTRRKTRSTIEPTLLGSSTPYVKARRSTPRSRSDPSPQNSSKTSANATRSTIRNSRSKRSKSLSTPENTEDAKKHISANSTRVPRTSRSRSRLQAGALLHDAASPRSSKRPASAAPAHSPALQNGVCTPENRHSPEEASTPVLSIQSLLDSSQSSFSSQKPIRKSRPSFNTNRKTIGGVPGPKTRVGAKSKSLSFTARKTRLRLSSDSVEILNKNDDSEIATPKSAVKLVPEGVKNKHSTAKKPQSKRSIIDDLNESDIVKQLFNSPVKRKLSQSMSEFSRQQLAQHERADHTDCYTPDLFVSPISTPTRSPSLEGIKLMFAKTNPENDLRDVRGVKGLLRTPRARKSVKNDLTNVSGVKQIFAKSPKNRLSDVRVKEVFVLSPKNDLRRVTGVKSLFQVARTRKSPRNELDDVRGVKKLFNTKSPANDLGNVSGVKRTLRRQSPKNDLSDVRGVKRVFRRERRNDLSDVSGVEELFNLSNHSSGTVPTRAESLFDQLVGKPQKRAVYSKTFSSKTVQKTKGPRAKSLHASLDQVAASDNNWLEQELNKRLQIKNYLDSLKSANTSKANKSKQNKSKSLHATLDEVSDVDVSLEQRQNKKQHINNDLQSKRSVNDSKASKSEANKSNANKSSTNRSRVNRPKASVSKANMSRKLQKLATATVVRLCQHSTPVKGGARALDVSALARVSPIRAHDDSRYTARDTCFTSTQTKETTEVRPKSTRGTRANTENQEKSNALELVKPSPKKTRGRSKVGSPKAKPASPFKEKSLKDKKASDDKAKEASRLKPRNAIPAKAKKASSAKAKKASPAKAKKTSPAKAKKASPAKPKKASPAKAKKASPIKTKIENLAKSKAVSPVSKASSAKKSASPVPVKATRSRRNNASTLESNIKKRRASIVVAKKSPVMSPKPRATRKRKEPDTTTTSGHSPKKSRAARKNTSLKDDKPKTPKSTRAKVQRATVLVVKPSPQLKPQLKPRAGRRPPEDHSAQETKETTRKTRKTVTVQEPQPESPKKSQAQRKSGKTKTAEVQTKTRGRKTAVSESKDTTEVEQPKTKRRRKTDEPAAKKTKREKSTQEAKPVETRGKKVETQDSVESAPRTRGRRGAKPACAAPGAKLACAAPGAKQACAAPGAKQACAAPGAPTRARKRRPSASGSERPAKVTRPRSEAVAPLTQLNTRGRKANIENVPANQATGKRKRAAEPSPAQERNTRSAAPPAGKPAGRSRRR